MGMFQINKRTQDCWILRQVPLLRGIVLFFVAQSLAAQLLVVPNRHVTEHQVDNCAEVQC